MRIIVGADIVPTKSNINDFSNGKIEALVDENIIKVLSESDYRIFNLEIPLTDKSEPIEKCGPNLIAPVSCINGIKKINPSLLTLANNHIMDHGEQGLVSTVNVLSDNKIDYVGAGKNLNCAQKPYIFDKDGLNVGVYACAEHEFSIADENTPGANPFDVFESPDHIADLKKECDYVIVLYHGGKEHYRYPSPNLQRVCRKLCDKGADIVICQHSHCIGCEEKYNSSTIVYGQGNFIFDDSDSEFWQTSILVDIDITDKLTVNYIPLEKSGMGVKLADNENGKKITDDFFKRSEEIKIPGFIFEKYSEFAKEMKQLYINTFCGRTFLFKLVNKICGHKLKHKIPRKREVAIRNYVECEAHRELLITAFKQNEQK